MCIMNLILLSLLICYIFAFVKLYLCVILYAYQHCDHTVSIYHGQTIPITNTILNICLCRLHDCYNIVTSYDETYALLITIFDNG